MVLYIASSESCEGKRFVRCWRKVERKYTATTRTSKKEEQPNQFNCQPEHGFCQQDKLERGQVLVSE